MSARTALGLLVFSALALAPSLAGAQSIIKHPGDHPRYSFEAEPHLAMDPWAENAGFGPGFRGTFVVMDNGFVQTINNSIGIGVGLDWLFYGHGCPRERDCKTPTDFVVPVVMQWNFWLHPKWSVFGEPGVAFHFRSNGGDKFDFDPFVIYGGGRFHFTDNVTLTMRLGAPTWHHSAFSIGVSFLL
jgi:hypothetical protein